MPISTAAPLSRLQTGSERAPAAAPPAAPAQRSGETALRRSILDRKAVLLFYKEAERDTFFKHDRYLKRVLRPLYNLTHRRRKKTGFRMAFDLLVRSLQQQGYVVRINDYATARRNPHYPVGLLGYSGLIDRWKLPNPALLGGGMYDHPLLAPHLMQDPRFRTYLVPSQWCYDLFHPYYGDRCAQWHAGIDVEQWPDTSGQDKDIDFLVYDKIMWDYDRQRTALLEPIRQRLIARGFRIADIRYLHYDHDTYGRLLQRARAMVFLCEHETQGIAYQEALASNVPILAWDNGTWLDPVQQRFGGEPVRASSVPFFSPACGERFADLAGFEPALNRFVERLPAFTPRQYVGENLSLKQSAEAYAQYYFALLS